MTVRYTAFNERSRSGRPAARRRPRRDSLAAGQGAFGVPVRLCCPSTSFPRKRESTDNKHLRTAAHRLLAAALLALLPAAGALSADDERGRTLYLQCKRCHQVGSGAEHRIGPHLNDVFGRPAGSLEGFRYSPAMKEAGAGGLVWNEATLAAFLSDPHALVPHSRMSYAGMAEAQDRENLLAWLRGFAGARSDLPPAESTVTPEEYGLDPSLLTIAGDPEYGAYLAGECTTCHRSDGSDRGIPSITGWPLEDFVIALQAYKRAKRVHPVMQLVAGRLSDEEIAALAAHFRIAEDDP